MNDDKPTEEVMLQTIKMDAFVSGIKVASLAMRDVLARKVAVGIIAEETAKAIFEATGDVLTDAMNALPENDNNSVS